jgi:hypothetical protein
LARHCSSGRRHFNLELKQDSELDLDLRPAPSRRLTELIARALLDEELRERLFTGPEAVARDFELSSAEAQAIGQLDRAKFEEAVARLRWG